MATVLVNGVTLYYELTGSKGDPLILVHGSWVDHHNWDIILPNLAHSFRVLTYDRRGHGVSGRNEGGSIRENVSDLAQLIEQLGLIPAHMVGNSFGGCIVLRLAAEHPEVFRSLQAHEPPLMELLADNPEMKPMLDEFRKQRVGVINALQAGDAAAAARLFVEHVALDRDGWERIPGSVKRTLIDNASAWLDQTRDADALNIDLESLRRFKGPALLTRGDQSPQYYAEIFSKLTMSMVCSREKILAGVGHLPHITHPIEYAESIISFAG